MIGMQSTPQQDLQALQPAMQQPMPQPMPMPQMGGNIQMPGAAPQNQAPLHPQMAPFPTPAPAPTPDKGSIIKKAVKKAGGVAAKGLETAAGVIAPGITDAAKVASKAPAGMKWLLDYMASRHKDHLDHEREILKSVLEQAKTRGGAAPDSLSGNEQAYKDNVRNTGNHL